MMAGYGPVAATIILLLTISVIESKNVVFLPVLATSHVRLHAFVAEELAKMDHNVWVAIPSGFGKTNEKYKGVHTFSLDEIYNSTVGAIIAELEGTVHKAIESGTEANWDWIPGYIENMVYIVSKVLKEGKVIEYIKSLKPDLIVIDWFPNVDERIAIPYKLKVPFAVLSALQDPVTLKMPFNPVAEVYNSLYFRNQATLLEKVRAIIQVMSPLFQHLYNDRGFLQKLSPDEPNAPAANELMSQAEVFIVESDPIFDHPRPALPNLKLIGGLSSGPAKELPEPFKSFVERSKKAGVGVAVLSFGSLIMNLPKKIELKLISVFKRIKLNTIWRANITSPDPNKILTSTWLPVNDLLGNENVKVFMTHCGLHSMYEGLYHAVPMVCLPIFYDQQPNADRAVDKGYCISLDFIAATEDELVNVIEEVASSQKIKSSIGTASEIYRELYKNPRKEAAFWLDHVIQYGGSYMRYSGQKIPMYLFLLDYFIVFLAGVLSAIGIFAIYFLASVIYSFFNSASSNIKRD
jgi:glucuronosyltransferase